MDVAIAALALAVLGLPMLLIAALVRLTSPGPALFSQPREGRDGRLFEMLKFRTMRADQCDREGNALTRRNDPRVTRLGRILRRTSLDELPQLLNVLRGDMSIVGPRPHPPSFHFNGLRFEDVIPDYTLRHRVRPGITGLAQIRGFRGMPEDETEALEMMRKRTAADLRYGQTWTIGGDVALILRTLVVLVRHRSF
jgi:lipopolysaccharide/colanic/teichoic acid biosynthesis glycosyltransferase